MNINHVYWHNKRMPLLKSGQIYKVRGGNVFQVGHYICHLIDGPGFPQYADHQFDLPLSIGDGDSEILFIWNSLSDYMKDVLEIKK